MAGQIILNMLWSILASLIMFYLPGRKLTTYLFFTINPSLALSYGVGITLWALLSYFLHYLNLSFLLWVYLVLFIFTNLHLPDIPKITLRHIFKYLPLIVLIFFGLTSQLVTIFPSGLADSQGIWHYNINAFDGIYFSTLSQSLTQSFPPLEPGFSGHLVKNYHYLSNLVIADMSIMFNLPISFLQFQFFPLLLSLCLGLLAYQVGKTFTHRHLGGWLFTFFIYFGSDFGYLTSFILLGKFSVTNLQFIENGNYLLTNSPRAFALLSVLTGLELIFTQKYYLRPLQFLFLSLILVSAVGLKIYFGFFNLLIICLLGGYMYFKTKNLIYMFILSLIGIITISIFMPTNSQSGGIFFALLAWPRHYFASGALQELQWALKEQVYLLHRNYLHLIVQYLQYLLVFLFTVLGTRFIGLFNYLRQPLHFILIIFIIISVTFLQTSGLFDIFNFLSVAAILLGLLTADFLSRQKLALIILVVLLSLPRPLTDLVNQSKSVLTKQANVYLIKHSELSALSYLKTNSSPESIILVDPNNPRDRSSPYISFYSQHQTFLSNLQILTSHHQSTADREILVSEIFNSSSFLQMQQQARQQGITYIYFLKDSPVLSRYIIDPPSVFYENEDVIIIKTT